MSWEPARKVTRGSVDLDPHPDACSIEDLALKYAGSTKPLAIDLFCGCGGLSLGLQQAGFEVILGIDIKADSVATHQANFGGASLVADLSSKAKVDEIVSKLSSLKISLVAGGPPCQPFSRAGRALRKSLGMHDSDYRRDLWRPFLRFVTKLLPNAALIENVPDMALSEDAYVLRSIVEKLEQANYSVYTRLLHGRLHGVPQLRPRLFIVAFQNGIRFHWPKDKHKEYSLRDAIGDLPVVEAGSNSVCMTYSKPAKVSALQRISRWGLPKEESGLVFDHYTRAVRDDDLVAFRMMTSRTRYSDLPEELRRYRSDIFDDKYNRLAWDKPSRTITAHLAKDGYWYIHPSQNRTITVREAARIQTFPDSFRFQGGMSNAFRQIGEAVPPLLAASLGRSILRALKSVGSSGSIQVSTQTIMKRLVSWQGKNERRHFLGSPWRRSTDVWQIVVGELILAKLSRSKRELVWPVYVSRWPDPKSFIRDEEREFALEAAGAEAYNIVLERFANRLIGNQCDDFDDLAKHLGMPKKKLLLCFALAGQTTARPITASIQRVASRASGTDLSKSAVAAELGVARLIGPDRSGRAYAALTEIAEQICTPSAPQCGRCPLSEVCVSVSGNPQESLIFDEA